MGLGLGFRVGVMTFEFALRDPWAFLNRQVPLSQHTRCHPRQTGDSCFNRGLHPIHYRRKVICRFYSLQTREAENVWEIERLFLTLGDPYLK